MTKIVGKPYLVEIDPEYRRNPGGIPAWINLEFRVDSK